MTPTSARQRIIVAVGLPGSGKSSHFARLGVTPLSSDHIRLLVVDDPENQTIHRVVFSTLRHLLWQRLRVGRPVSYIDATNLSRCERRPYVVIGGLNDCEVEAWYFNTPLAVCLERNRGRKRVVPEEAMVKLAGKLDVPTMGEGFSRVIEITALVPDQS